jgi:hypothetical protein
MSLWNISYLTGTIGASHLIDTFQRLKTAGQGIQLPTMYPPRVSLNPSRNLHRNFPYVRFLPALMRGIDRSEMDPSDK